MFAWNMIPAALLAAGLVVAPMTASHVSPEGASAQVALAANEFTQNSSGYTAVFLDGTKVWPIKTAPVQEAFNCAFCELDGVTVDYPRSMASSSMPKGLNMLTTVVDGTPGFLLVVGYSQGAEIAENYQEQQVASGNPMNTDRMVFYSFGDPKSEQDIEDNPYFNVKVAWLYDGIAILPSNLLFNPIAFANMVSGIFKLHTNYRDIDLSNALVRQNGNTTHYLVIPEHLPLLQGWYDVGLGFMVSWAEPLLTKIVMSAYKDVLSEYEPVNQQADVSRFAVESTELGLTETSESFMVPVDSSVTNEQPAEQDGTSETEPILDEPSEDLVAEQPEIITETEPDGSDVVEEDLEVDEIVLDIEDVQDEEENLDSEEVIDETDEVDGQEDDSLTEEVEKDDSPSEPSVTADDKPSPDTNDRKSESNEAA